MTYFKSMLRIHAAGLMLGLCAMAGPLAAQTFPSKPVRVVLPFAPGGAMDAVALPIGEAFQKATGQSLVIEHVGGAGGLIGTAQAVRAPADGYSLLMASNGQVSIAPFVNVTLAYDPQTDLLPVIHIGNSAAILYASAKSPYKTLQDVIDDARRRPGAINFAHSGNGSLGHLTLELFAQQAGLRFTNIPYKGAGQALQDMASGEVSLIFTHVSTAKPYVDSGKMQPLAVAAEHRLAMLPDVPTFAELGLPDVNVSLWVGLMAPKGTPQDIIDQMAGQVDGVLKTPGMEQRLASQGFEITGGTPGDLKEFIMADTERWRKLSSTVELTRN